MIWLLPSVKHCAFVFRIIAGQDKTVDRKNVIFMAADRNQKIQAKICHMGGLDKSTYPFKPPFPAVRQYA